MNSSSFRHVAHGSTKFLRPSRPNASTYMSLLGLYAKIILPLADELANGCDQNHSNYSSSGEGETPTPVCGRLAPLLQSPQPQFGLRWSAPATRLNNLVGNDS
jgi:hypothetical protein